MRRVLSQLLVVGVLVLTPAIAAEEEQDRLAGAIKQWAESTRVRDSSGKPFDLVPAPVFHYSDQPRRILDGTLWMWSDGVRPVAVQKVEAVDRDDGPRWTICFSSCFRNPLNVQWQNEESFTCEQGIEFQSLTLTAEQSTDIRPLHLRQMARRFTARIWHEREEENIEQMRRLPRPIVEYAAEEAGLIAGALFGFASNGTNPDALLMLEAVRAESGKIDVRYGVARLTSSGMAVMLNGEQVWNCDVFPAPMPKRNWTFFNTPRDVP